MPFEETRSAFRANVGPYATKLRSFHRKSLSNSFYRGMAEDVGQAFGVGPYGLFSANTFQLSEKTAGGGKITTSLKREAANYRRQARTFSSALAGKRLNRAAWMGGAKKFAGEVGRASWGARARMVGRAGVRAIGPAVSLAFIGSAYQRGGVGAAAGAAVKEAGFAAAFGAVRVGATKLLGGAAAGTIGTVGTATAGVALAGYGTYKLLEAGNAKIKKSRKLEMGSPIVDPLGTAATMRQRSLKALQFSQVNGRSAFGSEAQLTHIPMMR